MVDILRRVNPWKATFLVLGILALYTLPVLIMNGHAGMYMRLVDSKLKGESRSEFRPGADGWTAIEATDFSVFRSVSDSATKREIGAAERSEFGVFRLADSLTPKLFLEAVAGQPQQIEISYTAFGSEKGEQEYQNILLDDALISSMSASSSGERPEEFFSINYNKIFWKYYPTGKEGRLETTPVTAGWDFQAGKTFNP